MSLLSMWNISILGTPDFSMVLPVDSTSIYRPYRPARGSMAHVRDPVFQSGARKITPQRRKQRDSMTPCLYSVAVA